MNVWKAVFLIFWLVLPVPLAWGQGRVEVPKEIVQQMLEYGYELEVSAAGKASNLAADPIEVKRGGEPALRVHGLGKVCGAANCVTWVYERTANGYRLLLEAGSINRIEPQRSYTRGYRDLMAVMHGSAWTSDLTLYKFDGERYQRDSCFHRTYQYEDRHGTLREWKKPKITRVECGEEAACEQCAIDESSVRALLEARDLESLDQAFSKVAREDEALKALYRARRLVFNGSREEELRFLEALPATAKELWRVYHLTGFESRLGEDPRIGDVVYGMFERAARYAQRYGSGHRRVLQLCLFSDGDLAETAWESCDWLLVHDSERTLAAIGSLPVEDQRRMCSGETAEGLTVEDAVRKCYCGV